MTNPTSNPRARMRGLLVAACGLLILSMPHAAAARPYTVVSCDSAGVFGYSSAAWEPFGNAGNAYKSCPTGGGPTAGISNRLIGWTYSGFSHSGHGFTAPPGATITHVRWAGRMARNNCRWATYVRALPSGALVLGLPTGSYCNATFFDNRGWPMTFAAPGGTTRLEQLILCAAHQCLPGATMHAQILEVTVDDPIPPSISLGGPLASGQWVSGRIRQFVGVTARDNAGVRNVSASLGPRAQTESYPCNFAQPSPCSDRASLLETPVGDLRDGRHSLTVLATDAAGNSSSVVRDAYVDNTAPDPVAPTVIGGGAWRRTNHFGIAWTNPADHAAPIIGAHWKLCTTDGSCPSRGQRDGPNIQGLSSLRVPAPGEYQLHVWLQDAAGNAREGSAAISAALRFDPEPPALTFEPTDITDPLRVVVNAVDSHSGVARGEIEMRATGTSIWHGLATERRGSLLVAHVDDERFRRGAYEFRAHAVDQAGNEASTGRRADGSAATLRLPARTDTRLAVGVPRLFVRRKVERRKGHRRVIRRRIRRLDSSVIARAGRLVRLDGLLATASGQTIDGATIEALEKRSRGTLLPVGFVTTGTDGKFRFKLKAARNREMLFRYGGSAQIGAATTDFAMLVPAATSIRPDRRRLLNGQQVLFSGQVLTRPLPTQGKLVELQAHFRGRWRTFSTVRAGPNGRWRFPYRFGGTVGRVTYRFRARLPAEGGYPFISGNSGIVKVVVLGT
jgi:hypothetical protein